MKKIGVWLDQNKALIITIKGNKETFKKIPFQLKPFKVKFEEGLYDAIKKTKHIRNEKYQLKNFFKSITNSVKTADSLLVCGLPEVYLKYQQELQENYPKVFCKVKTVKKAVCMTDDQTYALIRGYFISKK